MRPTFSDAEAPQILTDRKRRFDDAWRRSVIGDHAYTLSLKCLGFLPKEAQTELNLLKMERR
jgi:hypothetical protein